MLVCLALHEGVDCLAGGQGGDRAALRGRQGANGIAQAQRCLELITIPAQVTIQKPSQEPGHKPVAGPGSVDCVHHKSRHLAASVGSKVAATLRAAGHRQQPQPVVPLLSRPPLEVSFARQKDQFLIVDFGDVRLLPAA